MKTFLVAVLLISSVHAIAESPLTPGERFAAAKKLNEQRSALRTQSDSKSQSPSNAEMAYQDRQIQQIVTRANLASRMIMEIEHKDWGALKTLEPARLSNLPVNRTALIDTDGTECVPEIKDCTWARPQKQSYVLKQMTQYFGNDQVTCKTTLIVAEVVPESPLLILGDDDERELHIECRENKGRFIATLRGFNMRIDPNNAAFGKVDNATPTSKHSVDYRPDILDRNGNVVGYRRYEFDVTN